MPASVTLAVLLTAVTHATWNVLAHRIKDRLASFRLIGVWPIVVAIPLIVVAARPRAVN